MSVFTLESFAVAFAAFEVAWLLVVPLWQTRLPGGRWLAGSAVVWGAAVAMAARQGFFRAHSNAFPPAVLWVGIAGFFLAFGFVVLVPAVSTASRAVGTRTLVAVQLFRGLVGAAFLSLASKSQLGPTLAYGGGGLEVLVGVLSVAMLIAMHRLDPDRRRNWVLAWNGASTLALFVTVTLWLLSLPSPWQQFGEGALVAKITDFPYAALPGFVWPAMLLAQVAIFLRDDRF